ncbi:hypothetical protein [Streptomyces sp. NPDC001222]|uniref:hypothetical protein n=1 Tax=Streptomyces sp. NPDC001222 TaxID=3364548 RepID=UPI00367803C3
MVTGNTPGVRGAVVDQLLGLAPGAVVLAVSIQAQDTGYPIVQRCLSGTGTAVPGGALQGATGDPVVILRQDLLSLRRSSGPVHVLLALPDNGSAQADHLGQVEVEPTGAGVVDRRDDLPGPGIAQRAAPCGSPSRARTAG